MTARADVKADQTVGVAKEGGGLWVEARKGRDRGSAGIVGNQRNGGEEGVLVVGGAGIEGQATVFYRMHQGGDQLIALVGGELGVAHARVGAVKAADAAVPVFGELGAVIAVKAVEVARTHRDPRQPALIRQAVLLHIVDGRAGLARAPQNRGAADGGFHPLDRVVEA